MIASSSLRSKGIELIEEDGARSMELGDIEEDADQLLRLSFPLG